MTRCLVALIVATLSAASSVRAQEPAPEPPRITLPAPTDPLWDALPQDPQPPPARPVAIEYSDGYYTRAKIHKYASVATLPLFAAEVYLGQSLYDGHGSDTNKSLHGAVGAGIGGLFAINTVTGVWNLWEARKDPNHRTLRLLHGVLMIAADAGFALTAASTPDIKRLGPIVLSNDASTHRTMALTSIGIATGSYLLMLFGNK